MTVLVTLTLAGTDVGPFNLYSNVDGYTTPLATGVSRAALLAGYSLAGVPDTAAVIRATSTGTCTNYLDMYLTGGTTTTSTSSSTTSTSTTAFVDCIIGDRNALASCDFSDNNLITVTVGNTALITPGGYYYSGTGTRTYTAYIMDSTNSFILYTFTYTQVGSSPGTWTSNLPSNTLITGSYRLRVDMVNCSTGSSGTFSLVASCGTPD
jgi:hypothetical protein